MKNRLSTLRIELVLIFIVSIASIFLIELWFKNYPAYNEFLYDLGVIYLKFCYSFSAAIITYFLFIHIPNEERKAASYLIIHNKTYELNRKVRILVECLQKVNNGSVNHGKSTEEDFEKVCSEIDPKESVRSPFDSSSEFENWFSFLNFKSEQVRKCVHELLLLDNSLTQTTEDI